jgi:hypothetical protein
LQSIKAALTTFTASMHAGMGTPATARNHE